MTGYTGNIEQTTLDNSNFRQVLYTGQHSQLVVMSLLPGEEIGMEVHEIVDQFLRIEKGSGKLIINDEEFEVKDGTGIIIPAGAKHNVINLSATDPMKIYTLYSPPHHKDGTIHKTKADAEADQSDHI